MAGHPLLATEQEVQEGYQEMVESERCIATFFVLLTTGICFQQDFFVYTLLVISKKMYNFATQ
jgi:hypothetical protein